MSFYPNSQSKSFQKFNPHLYAPAVGQKPAIAQAARVRQSKKPLLNKLELDFKVWLGCTIPPNKIREQAITLRLCNGVKYTPDFFVFHDGEMTAWEVKGPQQIQDDASVKLKIAAHEFPEIKFFLVWMSHGQWKVQLIIP